jgi:hypothetical protein
MKYRLYPSLLNLYARYESGLTSKEELLDRINRVPTPQTEAQARGVSFESAVIKGIDEDLFDPDIIIRSRALLPRPIVSTQVYCEHLWGEVLFYGFVDVLGANFAVDLKSTKKYEAHRFQDDHQNLYLLALQRRGIRFLRYVVTDFFDVYTEEYDIDVDFSKQMRQIESFVEFLETNRPAITDRRIFAQ